MNTLTVWMDSKEARVFTVDGGEVGRTLVQAHGPHAHRHVHEQEMRTRNHPDDEHRYFDEIAGILKSPAKVLLAGPSQAKVRFLHYLQSKAPAIAARIVAVETLDHPSDEQLVAHIRHVVRETADSPGEGA